MARASSLPLRLAALLLAVVSTWTLASAGEPDLQIVAPAVALAGVPFPVSVTPQGLPGSGPVHVEVRVLMGDEVVGSVLQAVAAPGETVTLKEVVAPGRGAARVEVRAGTVVERVKLRVISGMLSLLPPLLAILLAVVFRQVIVALVAGVWLGALFTAPFHPASAMLRVVDEYLLKAFTDPGHASIIIFSMLLGGMVAIMSRAGGTRGIVDAVRGWAATRRSTQIVTWILGMFIFFDDYANTLIVGNTMRPVTDRLKISREKLAYLVDSTAAPVASVALISTWVGVEVSLIGDALDGIGSSLDPYQVFLASIPYRFYPLLALVFALAVAVTRRDFGPMLAAERRAAGGRVLAESATPLADYESSRMEPRPGRPRRWINAVLPILTVIGVALAGLWVTGRVSLAREGNSLGTITGGALLGSSHLLQDLGLIFSAADSYTTLMWGAALGCLAAALLAVTQGILSVSETIDAWLLGLKSMLMAMIILLLAWSIGAVCVDLHTAAFIISQVSDSIPWALLPALIFLIAGAVAFATGTSWGTMAILMPLTVPLAAQVAALHGFDVEHTHLLLLGSISSVLAGATWGDHCSPISDTTIMSSMAAGSDHIDHVRTQLPYALVVGAVGILVGDIPTALGLSPWLALLAGSTILVATLRYFGSTSQETPGDSPAFDTDLALD
ncbi:MAG: Na+/H+ antiporter NhaC family protein [Acidobacteriota bacterium]